LVGSSRISTFAPLETRIYIAWLAERPDADGALREPRARDFAARDFKRHLKLYGD
jgi:hypothetical protein